MILSLKQTKAIDYLEDLETTELLFGGAAGGGKSHLGCYWQLKRRIKYPGTRGLIGRAKLKTLKETTLKTFFEVCQMMGVKPNVHFRYNSQNSVISFYNGSEIFLKDLFYYPSDPDFDELGSLEITDYFIDEASQVTKKAKQITQSRVRYRLINGIPKGLMTCNPSKNWLHTDYWLADKNGTLEPNKKFIQSLVTDNPHIEPTYIQNLQQLDEASRQRLLYGNWDYDNDPTALVSYEHIEAMHQNDHVKNGPYYITCDVARFGSDKAIIYVWSGFIVVERIVFDISRTTDIQNAIQSLRVKYQVPKMNCVADEDGVGGGIVDNCQIKGFINNSKPKNKQYQNLKTECAYKLAEVINEDKIFINCELTSDEIEKINQEIGQLKTFDSDKDGKLRILSKAKIKENIGRSPDDMDNFIMRMYFELSTEFVIV